MQPVSSNVELPELPEARMEIRSEMRFPQQAATVAFLRPAATRWMMANCRPRVNTMERRAGAKLTAKGESKRCSREFDVANAVGFRALGRAISGLKRIRGSVFHPRKYLKRWMYGSWLKA